MHELSICRSIAAIAVEAADGRRVERVQLTVGHLRQVVPDTLRHAWELVVTDTDLSGAELAIDHVPAVLHCDRCGVDSDLTVPVFRCPACDTTATTLVRGDELLVTSIDVASPDVVEPDVVEQDVVEPG